MILSDQKILQCMNEGSVKVEPFRRECLGSNSYDVHLGKTLAVYKDSVLDAKKHNEIETFEIPPEGYVLTPENFYLGVTLEYTETHKHVPFLEGKSSVGCAGLPGVQECGECGRVGKYMEVDVNEPDRVKADAQVKQMCEKCWRTR